MKTVKSAKASRKHQKVVKNGKKSPGFLQKGQNITKTANRI
jgi:hypothetical protein